MTANPNSPDTPQVSALPGDAIVLHIGPYKTGTTALQTSFGKHRSDLAENGVLYPGEGRSHHGAVWALRGRAAVGKRVSPYSRWERLASAVRDQPGRALISTEFLSDLPRSRIDQLLEDLGPQRVHVVMAIRPLAPLLPSDWQEKVKTHGFTQRYEPWLTDVLAPHRATETAKSFWHLYGATELMARWGEAVPAERTVVIASDGSDRALMSRTFERLLGLPAGLLTPGDPSTGNPSLSQGRIELLRQVNEVFIRNGWSEANLRRLVHLGLLPGVARDTETEFGDLPPKLPEWSWARVAELSQVRAETVAESAATVIGDARCLLFTPPTGGSTQTPLTVEPGQVIGVESVTNAIEALIAESLSHRRELRNKLTQDRSRQVEAVSDRELLKELRRRVGLRARRLRQR